MTRSLPVIGPVRVGYIEESIGSLDSDQPRVSRDTRQRVSREQVVLDNCSLADFDGDKLKPS
jgi:hypothetical protein